MSDRTVDRNLEGILMQCNAAIATYTAACQELRKVPCSCLARKQVKWSEWYASRSRCNRHRYGVRIAQPLVRVVVPWRTKGDRRTPRRLALFPGLTGRPVESRQADETLVVELDARRTKRALMRLARITADG